MPGALTVAELERRLAAFPRLRYPGLPTPLEELGRLTRQLGGPRLWIKRDDGYGPGLGGNKGRALEFIMADLVQRGRRKAVTFGNLQSNHARMTAAACAHAGVEAHLLFFARRPPRPEGNLLLDELLGAHMHYIPFGGGGDGTMTLETTNRLVRLVSWLWVGPGAYFIPVGGHHVTGCLGYVAAAAEIQAQVTSLGLPPAQTIVVTAAGTGGTLAGLLAGFNLLRSPIRVLGLDVEHLWKGFRASVARLASALCAALDEEKRYRPEELPLVSEFPLGYGGGRLPAEVRPAIRLMAHTEGIVLDPVFTGRAFARLLELIGRDAFAGDEHVIFLHTGGLPSLWAYEDQL
jgi:1-aminocyclopropane-1-carboxylate deaminase/D-cysteine desulfhydrase-like pyridoxal-dependent ACC family enzyme